jgi:Putative beta-barrel porin-2, OmpL-like. bbp2
MPMLATILSALIAAATPLPSPTSTPTPAPSASPAPPVSIGADFTLFGFHTDGVNGVDPQISNALITVNAGIGKLHANATVGQYSFPTIGFPILPANANGSNTQLYSAWPVGSVSYAFDNHFTLAAGKFATLLGQESDFTYQNLNIQRGIGWEMEPTISRGVGAAYTNGPWSLTLREDDAYYGGYQRAVESLIGWSPSSNTNLQFAFILPGANTAPNPTTAIGNKAEYDLMFTRQIGKLQLLPYFLWVNSPSSTVLGYTNSENAYAGAMLANWAFSSSLSVPVRYEYAANQSSTADASPNADLIGFGAGSRVQTFTVTPTYHFSNGPVIRLEYSTLWGSSSQQRLGFEVGVMH